MHYDGILTGDEYKFGSVAFIDRVDPDYFSLLELMKMAEHVGVEEEYYQFLWTKTRGRNKGRTTTVRV
ncbi:hypothetical protein LINPERPRIM_LOCUS29248 [Linum perenne]